MLVDNILGSDICRNGSALVLAVQRAVVSKNIVIAEKRCFLRDRIKGIVFPKAHKQAKVSYWKEGKNQ